MQSDFIVFYFYWTDGWIPSDPDWGFRDLVWSHLVRALRNYLTNTVDSQKRSGLGSVGIDIFVFYSGLSCTASLFFSNNMSPLED